MRLGELDRYFRALLSLADFDAIDSSMNGVQVQCSDKPIQRIAFAVDACVEVFRRAAESHADLLFVHHGLFWGRPIALRGSHYHRVKYLIEQDLALYAAHLPLDAHPELGNNAGLAAALGLQEIAPFGAYHGVKIGCKGRFAETVTIEEALRRIGLQAERCQALLPFGPSEIRTAGIVSGGATREVAEAIEEGLDLYITGEASHQVYHACLEEHINLICGGHYETEVWGVRSLSERVARETGISTQLIDVPTGL